MQKYFYVPTINSTWRNLYGYIFQYIQQIPFVNFSRHIITYITISYAYAIISMHQHELQKLYIWKTMWTANQFWQLTMPHAMRSKQELILHFELCQISLNLGILKSEQGKINIKEISTLIFRLLVLVWATFSVWHQGSSNGYWTLVVTRWVLTYCKHLK